MNKAWSVSLGWSEVVFFLKSFAAAMLALASAFSFGFAKIPKSKLR